MFGSLVLFLAAAPAFADVAPTPDCRCSSGLPSASLLVVLAAALLARRDR